MKKYFLKFVFVLISIFFLNSAYAASVSCSFMSETTISKSGEWLKDEADFMKLYDMFGDGLEFPERTPGWMAPLLFVFAHSDFRFFVFQLFV